MSTAPSNAGVGTYELCVASQRSMRRRLDGFRMVAAHEPQLVDGARATLADAERIYREMQLQVDIAERALRMAQQLGMQLGARLTHANYLVSKNFTKE